LLLGAGDLLAQVVGDEFDLVSFDPRGVARSTPKVLFYDEPGRGEREIWALNEEGVIRGGAGDKFRDIEGESGKSLESTWAHAVTSNLQAGERAGEWLGNVNTEQTAYDMLSIVKAYGREKLMYWGFSYGTVLGSTFATLFPVSTVSFYPDRALNGGASGQG
jgi:pimeloyl-ACP methyl ester carboxylesterase